MYAKPRRKEIAVNKVKKLLKTIFFPHLAIVLLIDVLVTFSFVYSSAILPLFHNIRIFTYAVSGYAVILTICAIPEIILRITGKKIRPEHFQRLAKDTQLQINISLYGTLAYNTLYATFQLFAGIHYRSVWYLSIATYYTLLAIMRFSLLHYSRANKAGEDLESEYRQFRFCGILLLIMNSALSAITFYITYQNQELRHPSAMPIIFAAFTLISFIIAIVNAIRYRKHNSPLFFTVKLISLVSAVVSVLALETAAIGRFSDRISDKARQIITGITGFGAITVTVCVGIFMIVKGTKKLKELNNEKEKSTYET